ncbi:MAG TPA: chemotaxis protein CheW [Gammaproteobacteria bacterium]|nr:chemotaxis protein CheW [Gammaproteobacteria bacterium]
MSAPNELYSLLIPLRNERILVPRMCVAEVIAFADTEKRDDAGAPDWLLGTVDWNGRRVPVITLDDSRRQDETQTGRRGSRSRIVIFHALGSRLKPAFYGILTQGFPQLVRVNRDVLTVDSETPPPAGQPMLCRVRMIHEFPLIPDLEAIEQRLADLASAA